jgi:hypothetical protein
VGASPTLPPTVSLEEGKGGGRRAVNNGRHERQTRRLADSSEQKGKSDGYTRKRLSEIETTQTTRQPPPLLEGRKKNR